MLAEGTTLVLYVFSNTDPEYYQNLLFFVEHGMPGCDNCDYVIIINGDLDVPVRFSCMSPFIPPPNLHALMHVNHCYPESSTTTCTSHLQWRGMIELTLATPTDADVVRGLMHGSRCCG